jgi:hypothetical protein
MISLRTLGNARQQGLGRYGAVVRALVESAAISWMAMLGTALAWGPKAEPCESHCFEVGFTPLLVRCRSLSDHY